MSDLGFAGLGRMGRPMLLRLLEARHSVHVHDPDAQAMAIAVQRGAKPCASPAAVVGPDGLAQGTRARLVVDLSTTGPRVAAAIAATFDVGGHIRT